MKTVFSVVWSLKRLTIYSELVTKANLFGTLSKIFLAWILLFMITLLMVPGWTTCSKKTPNNQLLWSPLPFGKFGRPNVITSSDRKTRTITKLLLMPSTTTKSLIFTPGTSIYWVFIYSTGPVLVRWESFLRYSGMKGQVREEPIFHHWCQFKYYLCMCLSLGFMREGGNGSSCSKLCSSEDRWAEMSLLKYQYLFEGLVGGHSSPMTEPRLDGRGDET